ncbi:MAG: ABC transporter substrate-binding protein [Xanthobacteraceae bacterium]|nr:MAG: ABC transporter substrate-binding protein [Xanthobacteraceae bacterium]
MHSLAQGEYDIARCGSFRGHNMMGHVLVEDLGRVGSGVGQCSVTGRSEGSASTNNRREETDMARIWGNRFAHMTALAGSILTGSIAAALGSGAAFAADPYDINTVLPLTGRASFLGKGEQVALRLLEKTVNTEGGIQGRPVHFIFHDDQSSPQVAVQLITQIKATSPSVVLGSAIVAQCQAMSPLVQAGPFMYCFSPGIHPKPGEFIYTSTISTRDAADGLIRYFRMKGLTRIAVLTSTDATGQDAERGILQVFAKPENSGMEMVAKANFNPADISVTAQIERIKAAQPHAVIAWSTGAAIGNVFKAIAQAELNIPIATTLGNMTIEQMTQYAAFLPKQLLFPTSPWLTDGGADQAHKRFHDSFKNASLKPDASSTYAWDPAMIVIDALRKLGTKASAEEIRAYVAKLKGYAGVNGVYDFEKVPQRGLDASNVVISAWNASAGNWEIISKRSGIPF